MSVAKPQGSLAQAIQEADVIRNRSWLAIPVALILSTLSVLALRRVDPGFLRNPVLMGILGIFLLGEILFLLQIRQILTRTKRARAVLGTLLQAGSSPDLPSLERALRNVAQDPFRDLVLGWLEMGRLPGGRGCEDDLARNSSERRVLRDDGLLATHATLNRVVMKVGFLGTLVGLLLTFPPMKRAILGLSGSEGEMTFIRDIAKAIDEDAYAIQATLVATAISLLMETFVAQVLERLTSRFALIETLVADWRLLVLHPASKQNPRLFDITANGGAAVGSGATESRLEIHLEARLAQMEDALGRTDSCLERLIQAQERIGNSVADLADWERDYRAFLAAKDRASAPLLRRVES